MILHSTSKMEQRLALLGEAESEQAYPAGSENCSSDRTLSPSLCDDEKLDDNPHLRYMRKWQYIGIYVGLAFLFVIFGIGSIVSTSISLGLSSAQFVNMGECGRTPQEARDSGCVFDLMMSGWVHPPCYDQELSDEFLLVNNFTFYREREGINIITEAEARLGNYEVIYSHGTFHYQHCAYIWAKQIRANRKSPLVLDSVSRSKEHVEHCYSRVGSPNITQIQLATGTKIKRSAFRLRCMIGEMEVF
ncbi:uncharacterized protein Bfra_012326 [Botrytis fragariae]|uniref:Uncharacterized protein n=1 Tax=Botrytis fragariae TaxID=1964551 RepID=A0A8H6AJG9_9HELO|nr:uncharacterized protein Bfra_012326 [Botrytis fragariae]KAF5868416.1 hypothetical protein Bfra_012326 [Botrytis fragariae]